MDRLTCASVQAGNNRVIVWGSIVLDDYVHGQSDIDLLLVCPGEPRPISAAMVEALRESSEWDFDVLAISEEALTSSAPISLRTADPHMPYQLHGMDLVQLKEWSVPIAGTGIRELLPCRDAKAEALAALKHAIEVMVPRHLEELSRGETDGVANARSIAVEFVLLRNLYTLRHEVVTSKRAAATWAREEYRADPRYGIIGEVGERLLAYREARDQGMSRQTTLASTLVRLAEAIAEVTGSTAGIK